MPEYLLTCRIREASGKQEFIVEAADEAEAIALHNQGKSKFVDEEVIVDDLGPPMVELNE